MANSIIPKSVHITTENEPEVRFVVPFDTLDKLPGRHTEENLNHKGELIVEPEEFKAILQTAVEAYSLD